MQWRLVVVGLLGISLVLAGPAGTTTTRGKPIAVSVEGRGKVTSRPRGISCPRKCRARFNQGARVRLVARAAPGWKLSRWAGACSGKSACSVKLDRAKTVRATFDRAAPPPPPPPPPPPQPLTGTGGLHSTLGVNTIGAPVGFAAGFGSVWLRTGRDIVRIDAATGTTSATIPGLPTAPPGFTQTVAAGEGAIWTSNIFGGSVSRIDPATNRVVATIPVWPVNVCGPAPTTSCSEPVGIVFTPGAVWVALHHEWVVQRIDPATNSVVATIPLGSGPPENGPSVLAAANGYVYAGGGGGLGSLSYLLRIDPATNAATPVLDVPGGCGYKAASGTHLWIAIDGCYGEPSGSIADIDLESGTIAGRVAVGGTPIDVAIGSGSVWAVTSTNELVRIDPASRAVTGRLPFSGRGRVAVGAEGIWLAIQNAVYRIGA